MATVYNNLPGVRRKEINLSDNLVPRVGNTVGMVVRSYKGPIKRPVTITSESDYVSVFGAPVFTSGVKDVDSTISGFGDVMVPDYGYGAYAAIEVLKETSSLIVVRGFATTDSYSNITMTYNTPTSSATYGVTSGTTAPLTATPYADGDMFDSPTFISTLETAGTGKQLMVSHVAPSTYGNNVAITVEVPSISADWLYKYDGYPTTSAMTVPQIWDAPSARTQYFPIAEKMIKISVFVKPTGKAWDDLYTDSTDRTNGVLRIKPVEVFYGTTDSTLKDVENNSLFIASVVNGKSQFIYVNTNETSPLPVLTTNTFYVTPYGYDSNNAFYVKRDGLRELGSGVSTAGTGLSGDESSWNIFNNRKEITVDLLVCPSWKTSMKQKVASIAANRLDCFAEVQSNPPSAVTVDQILANETYGYASSSYVGLNAGFSKVTDEYNRKEIWLPNAIKVAAIDLRTQRVGKPWTAPAGTERGVVTCLGQLKVYNDAELDRLYGNNINPISKENGYGFVVWGQRTAQLKKSALDRKNVRFNLLYIENNIEKALKQFIFENNTSQTRLRCFSIVDEFLGGVKAGGGLYDYSVVCDESNNPPSVIDANQMNLDIYVQPVRTAEIINFTTVVTRTGESLNTVKLQYV